MASQASKASSKLGNSANMIEPFPAPKLLIEPFPAPKIPPLGKKLLPNVPPARYDKMVLNQAKVKSVLSGDSLVLSSIAHPDRERTLSLAYSTAPHLKKEGDEQGAYESRDALRELLVGKTVQFSVLYTIPNTKREYGVVYLNDGRKLPEEMVKQGWLKLREDAGRKEDSEEALQQLDQLRLLEAKARSDDLGLWNPSLGRIEVQHDMGDAPAWLEKYKGQTLDGLVERVLSGDRMLIRVILSPNQHVNGKFCPSVLLLRKLLTDHSHDSGCWNSRTNYGTCQSFEWPDSTRRRVRKRSQKVRRGAIITTKCQTRYPRPEPSKSTDRISQASQKRYDWEIPAGSWPR